MNGIAVLALILVSPAIFIWSWLSEQPLAIKMAWWDSFGSLPRVVKDVWNSRRGDKLHA